MKKLSLEMGGKNPAIIFEDCDYELMMETLVQSSFANQGQICLCSSRILVEKQIYKKFKKDFIDAVSALRIGDPINDSIQYGAISSTEQLEKIDHYVELAKKENGKMGCRRKEKWRKRRSRTTKQEVRYLEVGKSPEGEKPRRRRKRRSRWRWAPIHNAW